MDMLKNFTRKFFLRVQKFVVLVLLAVGVSVTAQAQTWKTTATSTDWFTASNWSTGIVPTSSTDVIIPVGASFYPDISTGTANAKTITMSTGAGAQPALTVSGGTLVDAGAFTMNAGTANFTGGTFQLNDYIVATGLTVNQSGTSLLKISRHWKNSGIFNATAGTVQFIATSNAATFATGTNQFFNIIVNAAVDPGFSLVAGSSLLIAGDYTGNNTTLSITTNTTFTFNGTGSQTITNAVGAYFGNVVVNKTAGTLSLNTTYLYLNGSLTVNQGTFSTANNELDVFTTVAMNGGILDLGSGIFKYYSTMTLGGGDITGTTAYMYAGGDIILNSGSINVPSGSMDLWFSLTNNGSSADFTYGTVNLNGLLKTIGGTASTSFSALSVIGTFTMNNSNTCTSITFPATGNSISLTLATGITLTVNGDININQPTASDINALNINTATVIVNGNINIGGTNTSTGRISKIVITTGNLDINGNLVYNSATGVNATAVIDMAGGAGNTYLAGNMVLTNGSGTLTPGTTGTFTYDGSGGQTVGSGGAITYNNLTINKPAGTATLGAALSLVNLNLLSGTFASAGFALTISGNVLNNGGTMTGSPATTFTGTAKTISGTGTTDFGAVTINNGKTYTISNTNTCTGLTFVAGGTTTSLTQTSTGNLTVNGNVTLNQSTSNGKIIGWYINNGTATVTGNINIGFTSTSNRVSKVVISTGTLNANGNIVYNSSASTPANAVVDMSGGAGMLNLKGSLTLTNGTGTLSPGTSSTVNFNGTLAQSVSFASAIRYNNIYSNNAATVTVSAAVTSTLVTGDIRIQSGVFSNGGFAIGMGTSKTFEVVNGATFKLTGTSAMVTGTTIVKSFGATSTVEYAGTTQTVSNEMYGHLTLSSSSGAAVKTMPNTAMTIAGNLTSNLGAGTSVSYTALANYTIGGNVSIGASTTFAGSTFTHSLAGNWVNNGTYTASTSTVTMTGASTTISGSGTLAFNDLILTGSNISAGAVNISVAGNLSTTGVGSFTHASGGGFTMSGTSKTITGTGFAFNDLTLSGTISTTSVLTVAGNLAAGGAGSFTSSAGSVTMSGTTKTITATGAISLFNLTVTGTVTTATSFTITSVLAVPGSLTASAGTATFTGTSILSGTANLYNVTINGTSLQLAMNATLGIANTYTISAGSLNVTSTTPNTVHFNGTNPQNIAAGTFHHLKFSNGANTAAGVITVNGDFTINASASFTASSSYYIYVKNNFVNSGTFTASSGTVQFDGAADGSITGATTFYNIIVNKSSSTNIVAVNSNISVGTIIMSQGIVSTGTNTLNITTTRTGNGIILGWIQRTHAFTTGVAYEFESPNNSITFTAASGLTSALVKVTSGAVGDFPFGGSINRLYDISIPAGTYTATLRLHYEDAELNGNTESAVSLWKYSGSWATAGKSNNSTTSNWVEQTGLTSIATRWTFSDDNNVISWNGSVSTDWNNGSNWTMIQGSPGSIPSANDIVQIGFAAFTNAPAINMAAVAKSISFGSVQAATLTLSAGGSLTTQGNISGTWSANATHTINANNQNITVNGDIVLSDGTSNHAINLNIGTGTVTMTGALTESGGANITFSGSGALVIGNNFTYTSGTFTKSTGTVTFNGSAAQAVAAVNYNHLVINKSGIATISSATTISGNLTVTAGELDINAASTITGNVSIASGAILLSGTVNNNVGGNFSNSGTFTPGSGTITLNGVANQTISAGTFNNFTVSNPATTTITGSIAINGSVSLTSGTLDLSTYTLNRGSLGGSFSLSNGTTLYLAGAGNCPANYSTYTLGATSTVNYNGTVAQSVTGLTYGHLVFTNGTTNAKTLAAATTVNGDLTINSGATFGAASYTLSIAGNWTNSGTFTASTSTLVLSGTSKTINGNTTFYKLTASGTYSVPGNDITTSGLFYIPTGGSVASTTGTLTISGDLTNNGTLTSTGTTTFTGTGAQTIANVSATINLNVVNFNGTVSPTLSSISSPTYATVNINNTGGVTSNVGWTVTTAFNIAVGASFNGGTGTHNFNGSFTNNGTVSTSGTFNFNPSATQTIKLAGTSFSSTGTLIFAGSGAISVTGIPATLTNITISNTTGVTPAANWTMGSNFLVNSSAIFNAGTYSYSVGGNLLSSGTLNGGTSTFTMTSGAGTLTGTTTTTFYDLVISGTVSANADYNVSHNFTNNGSYDGTIGSLNMTGSAASIIGGSAATYNLAQLSIQKTGGAVTTLAHNILAVTSIDVTTGTLDASTYTITQDAGGGTFNLLANTTFKIAGTNTLPTFTTYSFDSTSTVEYNGAAQSISAATPYGNLVMSTVGNKTAAAALTVQKNLTLTTGTFIGGAFTHLVGGNWSMASGAFTNTGTTITLNGTMSQTVTSTGAFNNLTVNKASGGVTLGGSITFSGTLTFTAGIITTGSYSVITTSGTVSGAAQGTGWINGNLQRTYSTGTNQAATFQVGGAGYYSPVTLTFASITAGGAITVKNTDGAHPSLAGSTITADKNIPRYWTVTNTGGITFTTYTISLTWNTAENYAGLNTTLLAVGKYTAAAWSYPTVTGVPTTSNVQANAITNFGDFVAGEKCDVPATFSYTASPYCSNVGTASVTYNNGGVAGTFSSTAGLSLNTSTGAVNTALSTVGTYTVTNTTTGAGGCNTSATATITITTAPSATINYAGSPYCSTAGTATVTRSGTAGGTYSSTAGLTINAATGAITTGTSTAGTYTVTYTVAAAGGCSLYTTTASVTITATPSATISYAGSPYCSNAGTASVTRSGTAGGTYSSTAGLTINAATGAITAGTSTAGTYTVTYTVAAAGGCSQYTTTASITITAAPSATISFAGSPFCSNAGTGTVTQTGTAGGTYSSTAGLTINAGTGAITTGTSTAGTYTVTYTVAAAGGCSQYTTTTSVTITALPSATISYAGSPFCSNAGTGTVTQTGTAGGTYSSTAGLTINAGTGAITTGTSTAGTYTVTYTVAAAGGCSQHTTTTSVTITALPSATISYAGSPYCSNGGTASVIFSGTTGGTYSSTAGLSINAATGLITLGTSTAGTYTVTYTVAAAGGCSQYTTTTSVTITALPAATISYAGSPYCSNAGTASVTFSGTAGGTYSSTAGLTINATTGAITLGTSTAGTYTVTYTVASAGGCSQYTTTASVTVTAAPSATISYAGSPYCSNAGTGTVTQTGTAGGTYSSTAGLTINAATGAITTGTSTAGTYTVTYTVAAAGGCSQYTTTTSVTVTAAPSATISYAGSPYCINAGTGTVTQTGTAGGTYSSTAGLTINASTGAITTATSTAGTYTVTYTVAAAGGCSQYTTTASVTITALPAATISYPGSPYCSNGGTASVIFSGTAGGTYSSTAGLTINASTGAITLGTSTAGTYTVTYTIAAAGGCSQYTTTASVTITVAPSATISYSGSPFCSDAVTGTVTQTGTAGGTYSSTAGLSINASTGAITIGTSTAGTYTVTYTVAAAGGCSQYTTTTSVTINTLGKWSGAVSTAWTNTGNWQCGIVPTSPVNVIIPAGLTNYPTISSGTAAINNLTIESGASLTVTGATLQIAGTVSNSGSFTASAGTIELNGASQTIAVNTYNNLLLSGSGTKTAAGALAVNGTLTVNSGVTMDMVSYDLSGTLATVTNSSTIKTQSASATPLASGKTWTGTVEYNKTTGGQTVVAGTYTNLSNSNTSGTNTATGALSVSGTLTLNASCTFDMATYALSGSLSTVAGTGTLKTQNSSSTPLPSGKTWLGPVYYNSGSSQKIVLANYADLNASGGNRSFDTTSTIGISGVFTPGSGTYTITGSKIDFNSSGAQNIPAFTFHNVTVSGGNTKSVAGNISVTNLLFLGDNTTIALGNNFITLKSDSTNTASIAAVPTTAAITYGTGGFTVERYVIGRRKYRLVTSSVTTSPNATLTVGEESKSIWGNWQNAGNNTTANQGTIITGGSAANGFDPQTTTASMYTYDAVTRTFKAFSTANGKNTKYTPLKAGRPYYMFVYGDRTNTITTSNPKNTVLTATGTVLTGTQIYDSASAIPVVTTVDQFSLVGNPYASTIDWKTVTKSSVSKTIWAWDPNLNAQGGYVTVTDVVGGILISPLSAAVKISQYLQPGQAFFVKTTGTNPKVTIKESDKVNSTTNGIFLTTTAMPLMAINMLYPSGTTSLLADGTVVAFDPAYSNSVNDEDVKKFAGSNEVVSILNSGSLLSVETKKFPGIKDTMFLNMQRLTKPVYTLEIFAQDIGPGVFKATLVDKYLNTQTPLSLTDTNRISVLRTTDPLSYIADRFLIVFDNLSALPVTITSVKAARQPDNKIRVDWRVENQVNIKNYTVQRSADGVNFTPIGIQAANTDVTGNYSYTDVKPLSGDNFYRVKSTGNDGWVNYSVIVKVKADAGAQKLSVYPNPVLGGQLNVLMENIPAGTYTIRVINFNGLLVNSTEIKHTGGNQTHVINIAELAAGNYFVELIQPTNTRLTYKVIKL